MIETVFLDQLKRFSLVVNKRVTSNYAGAKRSIAAGQGILFKDFRIYTPGDDFRSIDWRVYARTDDLYVKTFEEDRSMIAHIIVDFSSSMNFGKPYTKFEYASMIGVGFAYLALRENAKFQFAGFSDTLEFFQPKKGMNQLASMVHYLNNIQNKGTSMLRDAINHYKKTLGSRSLVILISDFLIDIEEIEDALYRLGKHDIKVIQVLDKTEKDLDAEGDYKLRDSESGNILRTFISQRMKNRYHKVMENHSSNIKDVCNKLNIKFNQVTTDKELFDAFYEILA